MTGGMGVARVPLGGPGAIRGQLVDGEGRCVHWRGPDDVLLIALPCCEGYWPCRECHDETADHDARRWPVEATNEALRCGRCGATQAVAAYLWAPDACPACRGAFNPRCRLHHHLYFETPHDA